MQAYAQEAAAPAKEEIPTVVEAVSVDDLDTSESKIDQIQERIDFGGEADQIALESNDRDLSVAVPPPPGFQQDQVAVPSTIDSYSAPNPAQGSYSAPQAAPQQDSYGSPQAPVQQEVDGYGAPEAPVVPNNDGYGHLGQNLKKPCG